jgi:hypothetical protein
VGARVGLGDVKNSLQIAALSELTEHLRQMEGLHVAGVVWDTESRWKRRHSGSPCLGPRNPGDRSWGEDELSRQESGVAQVVADVARVPSVSTNSCM